MKLFLAFCFLVSSFSVLACPDISGTYLNDEGEKLIINQSKCEEIEWIDEDPTTVSKLIADNIERVVEKEANNIAYGKARFTEKDFVLELRVVYGNNPPESWPTYFLTSYSLDRKKNLVEKVESTQGTEYFTFKRVK